MNQNELERLSYIETETESFSISPENYTGEKGKGGLATTGAASYASRELGPGWKVSPYFIIRPGEVFTLAEADGSAAIVSMWFAGGYDKNYILRIYWDHSEIPSVECPLTDFFAYGWCHFQAANWQKGPFFPLNSQPVVVAPNKGLNCFWYMPFRSHCLVTIENRTDRDYMCYYQINFKRKSHPESIGYFHAQYRQAKPLQKGQDYVIADQIHGCGHYIGTALSVGLNGDGNWWGEGEVKMFLDDDQAPSICYTGTEDYFLGAYDWDVDGQYQTYSTPYGGMHYYQKPDGLYNIQPRFSMYRWHIVDEIHFRKNLKVTIQDLGWTEENLYLARRDDFFSVAYWYQTTINQIVPQLPDKRELQIVSHL